MSKKAIAVIGGLGGLVALAFVLKAKEAVAMVDPAIPKIDLATGQVLKEVTPQAIVKEAQAAGTPMTLELATQIAIDRNSAAYQGALRVEQEMIAIKAAGGDPQWDYHPGGIVAGATAREIADAGIAPSGGAYAQDLYLAQQLRGDQALAFKAALILGQSIQGALLAAGIQPYASITVKLPAEPHITGVRAAVLQAVITGKVTGIDAEVAIFYGQYGHYPPGTPEGAYEHGLRVVVPVYIPPVLTPAQTEAVAAATQATVVTQAAKEIAQVLAGTYVHFQVPVWTDAEAKAIVSKIELWTIEAARAQAQAWVSAGMPAPTPLRPGESGYDY